MEYNPTRKDELKHRDYLKNICSFQNVLNVDEVIAERITELYRMQVRKRRKSVLISAHALMRKNIKLYILSRRAS